MQKDEQLRRRDPKAHTAMLLGRREREYRQHQQPAPSHNLPPVASFYPMKSTQHLRWDAPMIATGDMLHPPSIAPDGTFGTGSMVYTHSVVDPSAALSTSLDEPKTGPLPSSNTHRRLSGTPEFTTHDLQKHIENSTTFQSKEVPQLEVALGEAIGRIFRGGSLDGSVARKDLLPGTLRKATRKDFQAIISRKCYEKSYEQIPDALCLSYARQLRSFVDQKAKTEEEYRHLASELKLLLDKESVHPTVLIKVLDDKLRSPKPDPPTDVAVGGHVQPDSNLSGQREQIDGQTKDIPPAASRRLGHHISGSGPINGVDGEQTAMNRKKTGSEEVRGGPKRSAPADEEHLRKKAKRATTTTTNQISGMKKTFDDLLSREAARPRGRS